MELKKHPQKDLYDFNRDHRQDTNIGLITIAIVIAVSFLLFGLFLGLNINTKKSYERGFAAGKKDHSTTSISGFQDHDSSYCEMMRDSI